MKHLFITLLFFAFLLPTASSQDLVIKTNGDTLQCVIVDVTYRFVRCISYPDREGPVYNILKEDVYMIIYENGDEVYVKAEVSEEDVYYIQPLTYSSGLGGLVIWQGDRRLNPGDVRFLFSSYPDALAQYNSGRTLNTIATVVILPSSFILGWQAGKMIAGGQPNSTMLIVGAAGFITGIVINISGGNNVRHAISIYNKGIKETSMLQLKAGFTRHGVGLILSL